VKSSRRRLTDAIASNPNIELLREEVAEIPSDGVIIIASGPLTIAVPVKIHRRILADPNISTFTTPSVRS
jgi:methylenetetrahydrofolate--tRNA-(uracil-5-)-methyltransferase